MVSLGVDIGGTGCKCAAYAEDGSQLAIAYKEYPLPPGAATLPADMLADSVFSVISECAKQVRDVAAITVSSFGESFVPLDEEGKPMTDILLYFGDGGHEAFDALVDALGEEPFIQIAKLRPQSNYSLAQMLKTKQASKFLFVAGFLSWKLSGVMATDRSLAGRSLLYDVERGCWSEDLIGHCGLRLEQMPEVKDTGAVLGTLLPQVAERLGLPADVQVVLGAHDQIAAALGSGVCQPGQAVDTGGTCECLTPMFRQIPDAGFTKNNFACVPYLGGYVTYAYNVSAGSVVRWYRDTFCQSYDQMNDTCAQKPTQLLMLPFLQGMGGTPDVDPKATGVWVGLTTQTTMPQLYRAVLEGITYELRYNMELLAQSGVEVRTMYAAGGAARSSVWLQIKADILNCPMIPVLADETGAMGCAILGFAAVTGKKIGEIQKRFCRYGAPILPNKDFAAQYDKHYERYKALRALYMERRI